MDSYDIAHWRLATQHLTGDGLTGPEEVVGWFAAVQAQDHWPAKWAVGQRAPGLSDADVEQAYSDGRLLRTHVLRPTWHFVLPDDIVWLLQLTAPRVRALMASYYRRFGIDAATSARAQRLLDDALRGGNHLTRKAVRTVLDGGGIDTSDLRLGFLLMDAELEGVICSGAMAGKQHTHALLSERAPQPRILDRDAALAELTLRYFSGHGPATILDFRAWSSLTAADAAAGLDAVGEHVSRVTIDDREYWYTVPPPTAHAPSPTVRLPYVLDEFVVGYRESKGVADVAGRVPSDLPAFSLILLDGQVVGYWKRILRRTEVVLDVILDVEPTAAERDALQAEAERYGRFVGLPATVVTRPS